MKSNRHIINMENAQILANKQGITINGIIKSNPERNTQMHSKTNLHKRKNDNGTNAKPSMGNELQF